MNLKDFKEKLFDKAIASGFSECEIYYSSEKKLSVQVLKGEMDKFQNATSGGVSFRGLIDGKMAYSYSEKIDETVIDTLIQYAKENAEILSDDEADELFAGSENYSEVGMFFEELCDVGADFLTEKGLELEKNMIDYDERISPCYGCNLGNVLSSQEIYNTKGLALKENRNFMYIVANAMAKDGDEIKSEHQVKLLFDVNDLDVKKLAEKTALKNLECLGAKSVSSAEYDIVFSNECFSDLLSCFASNFYAENVHLGLSLLKNKIGENISSDKITIVDEPLMKKGVSSCSFDSEGVACFDKTIVENGVLKTYLYNLKYAKKDGVKSTGNGFKAGFKGRVATSYTNFYIKNGSKTLEDLFNTVQDGLYITDLSGLHSGVNSISGDFSLIASGFLVKDGKKTTPVNQITVSGNFFKLLKDIEEIANDLDFQMNGVGSPSIFAGKLPVAGEN